MLEDWCAWIREIDPYIICGHNIFMHDLPYIKFIAERHGVELDIGRDGSELEYQEMESKFRKDGSQFYHYHKVKCFGRELIDTLFLALKYDIGRKYESYQLKYIIGFEKKEIPGRVFYDASQIRYKYNIPEEWEKIKQYAIHDGDDALTLYDLTSPPFFYFTQSVPKSFQSIVESASGSQVNAVMVRSYLQDAHSLPRTSTVPEFEGATSLGNPGIYRNVFKIDVASLYPNVMLQFKVYDRHKDPNQNFSKLVEIFTERRLKHKKLAKETKDKYYDDLQNSEKIFINSAYGFLGAPGLLFNSPENAAFVTAKGREILSETIKWAESRNFKIVNADTDSISFTRMDSNEIKPDEQVAILEEVNSLFPEKIKFENDGYYPTVIVLKIKNYILYDGKKITYKGSAIKASLKEPALKQFIKDVIQLIIDGKEDYTYLYNTYVREILNIRDIKRWATKKTITDKVLNAKRTNEQKVKDAMEESEYMEGDKIYVYFKSDNTLSLVENFDGDYSQQKLLQKLYQTARVFDNIIPKETWVNYSLKRSQPLLKVI
jgi:DNA polymerase I